MILRRFLLLIGLSGALFGTFALAANASDSAPFHYSHRTPKKCSAQMTESVYFDSACAQGKTVARQAAQANPDSGLTFGSTRKSAGIPDSGIVKDGDTTLYAYRSARDSSGFNHNQRQTLIIGALAVVVLILILAR